MTRTIISLVKRISQGTALILCLTILLYVSSALLLGLIPYPSSALDCEITSEVFLASNGKHIDLVLPATMIERAALAEMSENGIPNYIFVGWGDLDFYLNTPSWSDFSLSLALEALFLQKQTAIHLSPVKFRSASWRKISLCSHQAEALANYIASAFLRNDGGNPIGLKSKTYGKGDVFFLAKGAFSPVLTCNEWVNRGLHFSGLKSPLWSPFDKALLFYYQEKAMIQVSGNQVE